MFFNLLWFMASFLNSKIGSSLNIGKNTKCNNEQRSTPTTSDRPQLGLVPVPDKILIGTKNLISVLAGILVQM